MSNQLNFDEQFILEYFKLMREDINLRMKFHNQYMFYKFVVCGALLSFLVTNAPPDPELKLLGVSLVPIIAMLYDVTIAKNIKNLNRAALYIRDFLEPLVQGVQLWETHEGQRDKRSRGYGWVDIFFQSSFSAVTVLITVAMFLQDGHLRWGIGVGVLLLFFQMLVLSYMVKNILFHTPVTVDANSVISP